MNSANRSHDATNQTPEKPMAFEDKVVVIGSIVCIVMVIFGII